ncbi:cysteine--tRNA ligase [Candidatus Fermentibacteria bacterium]|nr:cysteine--tRNA ligase [Candidatus Fermentibacteria bacterium]
MLKLHDSLSREKKEFEPLSPPLVGMYVCGPTVYGDSHLGHAKSYVSFDVLNRYLRYKDYRVRYVQNITDVGHLTDDADQGEDKVLKQARLEKLEPMELTEKYTRSYFRDMDALNVLRPDISPRASGHIPEQIQLVEKLLEKDHAYLAEGNVYFSVDTFPDYGKLSGRKLDEQVCGVRVGVADDKRDPRDFALWKRAEKDHILRWRSPWGEGYPGWHLECSVMSMRYIGDTLDIHGGGLENIFPHHDCEIAQSEAATGKPFVRYWLHNNMVTVDGRKMGKSLGNYITLKDLFQRFPAPVVRLYILRSHYRKPLDFSDEALDSARSAQQRIYSLTSRLSSEEGEDGEVSEKVRSLLDQTKEAFHEAMDDDLNTPMALAALFDLVKEANSVLDQEHTPADAKALSEYLEELGGDVLGIDLRHEAAPAAGGGELLELLAELRGTLRKKGLYDEADAMRDRLEELGFAVMDLPDGRSRIHSEGC